MNPGHLRDYHTLVKNFRVIQGHRKRRGQPFMTLPFELWGTELFTLINFDDKWPLTPYWNHGVALDDTTDTETTRLNNDLDRDVSHVDIYQLLFDESLWFDYENF